MELLRFKANIAGKPRIEELEGRPHYVFPVRIWRKGVLKGNDNHNGGSTYFPAREIRKVVKAWNHVPIVVSAHPKKGRRYVTARTAKTINKQKVGVLLHNKWDGEWQEGEAWIDKKRINQLEPRFKGYVKRGFTVEVSIGVGANCHFKSGMFQGKRYDQVARDLEPDHLALLMDEVGACSVADGCGLFTASKAVSPKKMKRVQDAITNAWNGKSNCSCQRKEKSMKTKKKKEKLSRRKKVISLIKANVGWKKEDKEWLARLDGEDFNHLLVQARKLRRVNTRMKAVEKEPREERRRDRGDETGDARKERRKKANSAKNKAGKKKGKRSRKERLAQAKKSPKEMLARILSSMSPKQIVKAMPGSLGDMFSNGLKAHGSNRRRLIDIIVSSENSDFEKKELLDENLYPMKTLRKLAKFVVNKSDDDGVDDPYAPFMGIPGAPASKGSRNKVTQDHLPLPGLPVVDRHRKEKARK